jgi:four helix bundle protein
MRDHTKLDAFHLADELAVMIYKVTKQFPKEEIYGMTSQVRRASVSVPSNIVEGCARETEAEYLRFLEISFSSLRELKYQMNLAKRLKFYEEDILLESKLTKTEKVLASLLKALRKPRWPNSQLAHQP